MKKAVSGCNLLGQDYSSDKLFGFLKNKIIHFFVACSE
jgi:hypothetical protein